MILKIIVSVILIEALTNILSKSAIFEPVRKYCFTSNRLVFKLIHKILDCPYCTSVWVAMFIMAMYKLYNKSLLPSILALFFMAIVLHRLSNILHFIIDRLDSNHSL